MKRKEFLINAFALAAGTLGAKAADFDGIWADVEKSGVKKSAAESRNLPNRTDDPSAPAVYFTRSITPEGLLRVYAALGISLPAKCGVKISTGEPGGHHFLQPALIRDLVAHVGGTIVECNTAYGGRRGNLADHMKVAEEHGFTAIADVDILDGTGTTDIPVVGGSRLTRDNVGENFKNYASFLVLSHFKGHAMGGFGGALKNLSIGFASSAGKLLIHSAGRSDSQWLADDQDGFLEAMAEAAKAVCDQRPGAMAHVNVMNNLSVDCDCDSSPAAPTMKDIGVLASLDPGLRRPRLRRERPQGPRRAHGNAPRHPHDRARRQNRSGLAQIPPFHGVKNLLRRGNARSRAGAFTHSFPSLKKNNLPTVKKSCTFLPKCFPARSVPLPPRSPSRERASPPP